MHGAFGPHFFWRTLPGLPPGRKTPSWANLQYLTRYFSYDKMKKIPQKGGSFYEKNDFVDPFVRSVGHDAGDPGICSDI
jgi:hypothetical protein